MTSSEKDWGCMNRYFFRTGPSELSEAFIQCKMGKEHTGLLQKGVVQAARPAVTVMV